MVDDFFNWYQKRVDEFDIDPILVWTEGKKELDKSRKNAGTIIFNDKTFYFKRPNTRYYKNHRGEFSKLSSQAHILDNTLATTSELISEKKYKAFNIMYGKHYIIKHNGEFYSISPNLIHGWIDYHTHSEIMRSTYDDLIDMRKPFYKMHYFSLKDTLKKKKYFLKVMTEDCYDEYVKCWLASIFEFSDDEHYNNMIFYRNHGSQKFEGVFVFDKESTVFNPMIAKGLSARDIKMNSMVYDRYIGKKVYCPGECIIDRFHEIIRLVKNGVLEKKYCDYLNQLAQFDFCKAAKEVFEETGIKVNDIQIDMYNYGSEYVQEILQR